MVGELRIVRTYPKDAELNQYPREKLNRNVEAYDLEGRMVWIIEEAPHGGESDKAYMDIRLDEGNLVAGNWIGIDYLVDLSNGSVSVLDANRRPW